MAEVLLPKSGRRNGGDHGAACDPATDPYCDGGGYDNYTLEVVDRMGFDSFTPDSGVLAKTKNADQSNAAATVTTSCTVRR